MFDKHAIDTIFVFADDNQVALFDIGSGEEIHKYIIHRLPESDTFALNSGEQFLFLYGDISYYDAFGIACGGTFRYHYGDGVGLPNVGPMARSLTGNQYNYH